MLNREIFPEDWKIVNLAQVLTDIDAGKSPNCPDIPAGSGEWGVLKVSAVHPNGLRTEENKVIINPNYINEAYEVKDGDLLITRANTPELVGLTCLVQNPRAGLLLSDKTLRLKVNRSLTSALFISKIMQMPFVRSQIEIDATGSSAGMKNISQGNIRNLEIPLPGLDEQEIITSVLSNIDSTIAHTSTLIAKLKQMKAGLLHDLLTRGLDENGKLRDAIEYPEQFKDSPLGQIPKDWEAWALREVLTGIDAGKSFSCPDIPAAGGEWGVLKVSAVHPNGFKSQENKVITNSAFINPAFEVKHSDLLITRSNTYDLVGLTCLVQNPPSQLLLSDKTLRLNVNPQIASIEFLAHVMQMPHVRLQIQTNATGSSAGMKNISQEEIKSFRVALPKSVDEQNRIVDLLNSYSDRICAEESYLNKLKEQKKGLMHDLLTGRVRVTDLKEIPA